MVSFKPKTDKKINSQTKNTPTLDETHRQLMSKFGEDTQITIPKLIKRRKQLQKNKQLILGKSNGLTTSSNRMQLTKIDLNIRNVSEEIHKMHAQKNEYLLSNVKYIFDYFETKQNIAHITTPDQSDKVDKMALFFEGKNAEIKLSKAHGYELFKQNTIHKYMCNVNSSATLNMELFAQDTTICKCCKSGELVPLEDEGMLVCNKCGASVHYLTDNDKPSYKEPPKEICSYAYKRINHFKEILLQFQGKETINIPPEIMNLICRQIAKERINTDQLTYIKTKEVLKKLSLNGYYEHISYIRNKFGIPPPVLSNKLSDILLNLFGELQPAFAKHVPVNRINFLNHYYVFYKLCELLKETTYLPHIPMLKDRDKIIEQDEIWKRMCIQELNWEYIPTV